MKSNTRELLSQQNLPICAQIIANYIMSLSLRNKIFSAENNIEVSTGSAIQ